MCLSIKINRPECVLSEGEHAGFKFTTVHNGGGFRCGYVRIPLGHPWHGLDYEQVEPHPAVHGGLTFAEADVPCDADGPDNAWWLGFDCAHSGDATDPSLPGSSRFWRRDGTVRTQEYVENECRNLCEQAAKVTSDPDYKTGE